MKYPILGGAGRIASCLALWLSIGLPVQAAAYAGAAQQVIRGSVRLPAEDGVSLGSGRIVRTELTPAELSSSFAFSVSLQMRDFAGLQARIASGEHVPAAEMEAKYLPLAEDYARVAAWLAAQGFRQTLLDRNHTSIFVRGAVSEVARTLGVRFARVSVSDGEYTSAVSEPSVPSDLAPAILSVNGLQPEFRLRHVPVSPTPVPFDLVDGGVFVTPDNINSAYNIPSWATGAGQIVAIVGDAPTITSDLSLFWSTTGISQVLGNVVNVDVDGGAGANPPASGTIEANLDAQWISSLAPAAGVRVYVATDSLECVTQILNDVPTYPNMSVVSISYGNLEASDGTSVMQSYSQVFASLAAAGVSVVTATGDCGSNPDNSAAAGSYSATAPLGVTYPASDPSVTAVGGTNLTYAGNWARAGEVAWNQISTLASATCGGVSSYFAKPSWQSGNAVLAGQTMRCIPDVAAIADATLESVNVGSGYSPVTGTGGASLTYLNGYAMNLGGTSFSCPIWSAIAALINQARANAGLGPLGLMNPYLYPLSGTSAFNDIVSGTNGAYQAGPGYDLCSGLGSPSVANLIAALGGKTITSHRLANVSVRAQVGTGANVVIAGFVIGGASGTTKDVLVRGVGPGLTALGVSGALAAPVVGVYDSVPNLIASDQGWGSQPQAGDSSITAFRQATATDMAFVGAFSLTEGSADSAMVLTLPPGNYTVQVSGAGGTSGVALSEVYELNTLVPQVLKNLSARCYVGTGSQVAICGFVVSGNESAQLLVRGIGPALSAYGLTGVLAQPTLSVYDSSNALVATNTGWQNNPVAGTSSVAASYRQATAADMSSVGAFALGSGSADSALVITLPPGAYTAVVSGANSSTGTGLAEVYEMVTQ